MAEEEGARVLRNPPEQRDPWKKLGPDPESFAQPGIWAPKIFCRRDRQKRQAREAPVPGMSRVLDFASSIRGLVAAWRIPRLVILYKTILSLG